jgi:MoaA/NifB/PqqE/SkfB family radical SAM enzyme
MILTSACNFRCPYCRGAKPEYQGKLPFEDARRMLSEWQSQGLKNVRFSGGEPTLYPGLLILVGQASKTCDRVAISTNGSASLNQYNELIIMGVNDFSVSLDACCASTGDTMAGRDGAWDRVVTVIKWLSSRVYTTVGVVLTETNIPEVEGIVKFAHGLGVADIRLIPAAQDGRTMGVPNIDHDILDAHPILRYRIANLRAGVDVRGLGPNDNTRCPLVLDEVTTIGRDHYPCPIYMREQGTPIGRFTTMAEARQARYEWFLNHDTRTDPICTGNCLDFCRQFNNAVDNTAAIARSHP